jgi:hypothetical protein
MRLGDGWKTQYYIDHMKNDNQFIPSRDIKQEKDPRKCRSGETIGQTLHYSGADKQTDVLSCCLTGFQATSRTVDVKIAVGRHNLDYAWFGMFWLKGGSLKEPGSK